MPIFNPPSGGGSVPSDEVWHGVADMSASGGGEFSVHPGNASVTKLIFKNLTALPNTAWTLINFSTYEFPALVTASGSTNVGYLGEVALLSFPKLETLNMQFNFLNSGGSGSLAALELPMLHTITGPPYGILTLTGQTALAEIVLDSLTTLGEGASIDFGGIGLDHNPMPNLTSCHAGVQLYLGDNNYSAALVDATLADLDALGLGAGSYLVLTGGTMANAAQAVSWIAIGDVGSGYADGDVVQMRQNSESPWVDVGTVIVSGEFFELTSANVTNATDNFHPDSIDFEYRIVSSGGSGGTLTFTWGHNSHAAAIISRGAASVQINYAFPP